MRKEAVVGLFYSGEKNGLEEQLKSCFGSQLGAGKLNKPNKLKTSLIAVISPHAGYSFSGSCAAHAYKAIAESQKPDLFVILGPSHQGAQSCISLEDWKTPLGVAKVDKAFGKVLVENLALAVNEEAHSVEHSIEVQLPFLQFVFKTSNFKFLPLIVGRDLSYQEIAQAIKKTVEQTKKKVIVIASSDFTHYGPNYGYVLPGDVKRIMYKIDGEAIEAIKSLNTEKFAAILKKYDATICGALPILVLMEFLSTIKPAPKAKLLKYYTSGDVVGNYTNSVGYAAMGFY